MKNGFTDLTKIYYKLDTLKIKNNRDFFMFNEVQNSCFHLLCNYRKLRKKPNTSN